MAPLFRSATYRAPRARTYIVRKISVHGARRRAACNLHFRSHTESYNDGEDDGRGTRLEKGEPEAGPPQQTAAALIRCSEFDFSYPATSLRGNSMPDAGARVLFRAGTIACAPKKVPKRREMGSRGDSIVPFRGENARSSLLSTLVPWKNQSDLREGEKRKRERENDSQRLFWSLQRTSSHVLLYFPLYGISYYETFLI
jgi:hypothetical protein